MSETAGAHPKLRSGASLAVFAPSPVLTITIEPADEGDEIHLHAGGQGFWVSQLAARLGAQVRLCAPLGGETGTVLRSLLDVEGVDLLSVGVGGSNGAYVHDRRSGEREELAETESPPLLRHELDELYGVALTAGLESEVTLLTGPRNDGVLPPDTYRRLAADLRRNGRRVLADLSGEPLRAALRGGVDLVKLSQEEVRSGGIAEVDGAASVAAAACRLHDSGAANVVITRGAKPAVVLIEGRLRQVEAPHFEPLDERGAGDSMFAGLAAGLAAGSSFEEAIRVGAAAGALNVARRGLGTGHRAEIDRLAGAVRLPELPVDPPAGEDQGSSTAPVAT